MIHKFKQLGYNIVLDVNSGAVHLPDDCAYDMLDFVDAPMTEEMPADLPAKLPKYFENEVRESYAELYQLYRDGALFAEDALGAAGDPLLPRWLDARIASVLRALDGIESSQKKRRDTFELRQTLKRLLALRKEP